MNIVELKNTCRFYKSGSLIVKAVNEVALTIKRGEFAVLAGPSGSGKSTLLNLIGGLDRPDSGEVYIDGELLNEKSDEQLTRIRLEKIGFIFQAYNLIPVLSAYENIQFILQIRGIPDSRHEELIMPLIKELGLEGMEQRRPPELSGGQQQRVAVARAIILEPAIILADEPTANLDSETAINLLKLMKQLNEEKGITFLFSSHDPMVIETAKRVIAMRDGKIHDETLRHQNLP
ncbi:MAG: ABC transporter ATP-binding protein [Candidatus Rifleibacteriota bacterium]